MVSNRENLIFILDVRQTNEESFKQSSIKFCSDIIKQKICSGKKDGISFILVGTKSTKNNLSTQSRDGYANIYQYGKEDDCELYMPSWQLLMNFYQFVNTTPTIDQHGDWLEALVVAMNLIKMSRQANKVKHSRIILFYNFAVGQNVYDDYDVLTENLLKHDMNLIVVSSDIVYIDNDEPNKEACAIFRPNQKKSKEQLENEKYALNLVSSCNAKLCNFTEALPTILTVKNARPWSWNCQLRIGTEISIAVSGIIKAKNESTLKLCTTWNEPSEELIRKWGYFLDGNQIAPDEDTLIDGYMLGGTAIPYDDVNNDNDDDNNKLKLSKGLTFMGFIPLNLVYEEYFNGDSTYLILHQRGMTASAQKMDALIRVLLKQRRAILCWKVFSEKMNKPRVVVLIPNPVNIHTWTQIYCPSDLSSYKFLVKVSAEILEILNWNLEGGQPHPDYPATFNMFEMAHHAQYHFFEFPKLTTKNTECSSEQLDAIDNLIDSMDLTFHGSKPRETIEKNYLPFGHLLNIFECNFMNVIERKIIDKASEDDARFEELLDDKNFVEKFWKLPESIEEEAKDAANIVKDVFPLYVNMDWLNKLKANQKDKAATAQSLKANSSDDSLNLKLSPLDINTLKWTNPSKDFELLMQRNVFPIKDHTERDFEFERIAVTYCIIIWKYIFEKGASVDKSHKVKQLIEAIRIFRKHCFDFNAFNLYNKWISRVKAAVIENHLTEFWQDVIVENNLGLCFIGILSTEETHKMKEFYKI